jgi:hypothetical protein
MCGAELYREDPPGLAQTLASRIRGRASYAFSTLRTRSTARSEVLAPRARLGRIGDETPAATYALGEAALRDDQTAVDELRGKVFGLEEQAAHVRAQIDVVLRWANGAVERERVAVQPTRIERPGVPLYG